MVHLAQPQRRRRCGDDMVECMHDMLQWCVSRARLVFVDIRVMEVLVQVCGTGVYTLLRGRGSQRRPVHSWNYTYTAKATPHGYVVVAPVLALGGGAYFFHFSIASLNALAISGVLHCMHQRRQSIRGKNIRSWRLRSATHLPATWYSATLLCPPLHQDKTLEG